MNERPKHDEPQFGDYEVLLNARGEPWLLGSGSYGQTYKARSRLLGTELAIKVIRQDLAASDSVRQRFLNEGRALTHLTHEHIAMLRHFGISGDGQIYYAMDYCAGGTLAERVNRLGPRPPGEALEIIRQATSALTAAHAQGVIHRDLKPGNIMLAHAPPPLRVQVIDFGLAQASVAGAAGGRFHGTAQWASPEQLRELPLDGRSDLFALGLILWFLLVGSPPDTGSTAEILQRRVAPDGYTNRIPHNLPPDIQDLLGRLLESDPARRVDSARGLLVALDRLIIEHPYEALAETRDAPEASPPPDDLPRLAEGVSMDDRYARLTHLHCDLAGEWFEAELEAGRGTRIVFVLDEQHARLPDLRTVVRANLTRLWRQPVEGLPHFSALLENAESLVAEWEGACGGDLASWIKLRRKPRLHEEIAFLAGVARMADATVERGVPGVGLMALQVRLETDITSEGSGLGAAAPRVFPLLLGRDDLPPDLSDAPDANGSTLVLVRPELACDRIHMLARLIYRAVARHEVADAVILAPDAYVPVSGLSESGNQLLCKALSHRGHWDSGISLMRDLAAQEGLSLTGSSSARGSSSGNPETVGPAPSHQMPAKLPAQAPAKRQPEIVKPQATRAVTPRPVATPPPQPLPSPPTTAHLPQRHRGPRFGRWLVLAGAILAAGVAILISVGGHRTQPVRLPTVTHATPTPSVPSTQSPEAALAARKPYVNSLDMRFVEADTPRVMFAVWETRVRDFTTFVDESHHDAVSKNEFGNIPSTVELTADGPAWIQSGGSWKNPHFPPGDEKNEYHPVVCVSYHDAEEFCKWLTTYDTNLPAGWRYRLPSDTEWSVACPDPLVEDEKTPGDTGNYCGSEAMVDALKGSRNDLAKAGWADDWPRTAPVGSFKSNRHGLFDMGGNVAEWCATFYQSKMNTPKVLEEFPGLIDVDGGPKLRVLRGASWNDWRISKLRADYHDCDDPRARNDFSGFRVVLTDHDPIPAK